MSYLHALTATSEKPNETHTPDAVELEFRQLWDTTSDMNDDDVDDIREELEHWWGWRAIAVETTPTDTR